MHYKEYLIRIAYVLVPFGCLAIFMTVDGSSLPQSELQQYSTSSEAATTRLKMNRVQLGASGLSLSAPNEFTSLAPKVSVTPASLSPASLSVVSDLKGSESFQYESNGVTIKVDYLIYADNNGINLHKIRQQYEKDFSRLRVEQKVTYNVDNIQRSGVQGVLVNAEYPVTHLNKIQRFEILTFVKSNQVWRVTAKYKDCDHKGQAMVQWMLESIQIASS